MPWQPVQSADSEPEINQQGPAPSGRPHSLPVVPGGSLAEAAGEVAWRTSDAELSATLQRASEHEGHTANHAAPDAMPMPSEKSSPEERKEASSQPPGPAPAATKDLEGLADLPKECTGAIEPGNQERLSEEKQSGSAAKNADAQLCHGHLGGSDTHTTLLAAEAQLVEGCAIGPAHPCLLASDVPEAVLVKPMSSLDNLDLRDAND